MKKTFTINISGTIFHIEDDAYEVLQKYLINLKNHFGSEEEGKEIMADIEARIAEIFTEKSSDLKNVITILWVEEVIETMGKPEDFVAEESEEEVPYSAESKRKRRLYRDPEHRVIGGVCGGLGAYFNIDPVIMRIIFVVLIFITQGAALLAYLVLWIAVPKAVTTAQRLEMRGQEATVKNIEKSIREEVKEVQESYKKFRQSDSYAQGKKKMEGAGEIAYHILKVLLKVVVVILGVILVLGGIFGLLALISTLTIGHSLVEGMPWGWGPAINFPEILNYLVDADVVRWGMIAIGFLAGIPLLAMLFIGSKLVFRYKSNNAMVSLAMAGVWLMALIVLVVLFTGQLRNFQNENNDITSNVLSCDTCDILYLQLAEDTYKDNGMHSLGFFNHYFVMKEQDDKIMLGTPQLDIEKATGNEFVVSLRKSSRGKTRDLARNHASAVDYNMQLADSVLMFDPYFFLSEGDKWRDQKLHITLKIPEGKGIFLDQNMVDIIYDIENVTNTWDRDMVGKYWVMKPEGLTMRDTETIEEQEE